MSQPRRAKRIDKNQQGIVGHLRGIPGISVILDVNDILVGYNHMNFLFEIKNPDGNANKSGKVFECRKRKSQRRIVDTWTGQYSIVTTAKEILDIIGYPIER